MEEKKEKLEWGLLSMCKAYEKEIKRLETNYFVEEFVVVSILCYQKK